MKDFNLHMILKLLQKRKYYILFGGNMSEQLDLMIFLENMNSILANVLNVDKLSIPITLETKLINGVSTNGLDLSSIDYIDFIAIIETEYDIIYSFDTQIYTISDAYNFIKAYKEKESSIEK